MSSINYDDIFGSFLSNVRDFRIANQYEDVTQEELTDYLHKVIGTPYIITLFQSISLDDNNRVIEYVMKNPSQNGDDYFIINLFGKAMVYEWIHPMVRKTSLMCQMFSGKEVKFYAQANHLDEMMKLEETADIEVRHMIRDRGYILNDYLGGNGS